MILGVDHIALSCGHAAADAEVLEAAGFEASFCDEGAANREQKKPFLQAYEPLHDIAFCRLAGGVAVELTQHCAPLTRGLSPFQLLANGPLPHSEPWEGPEPPVGPEIWSAALGVEPPRAAVWTPFEAQYWYVPSRDEQAPVVYQTLGVPVTDLTAAEVFWSGALGFKPVNRDPGGAWALLRLKSPIPAWGLDVLLAAGPARAEPYLDQAGFPCLALLCSKMDHDLGAVAGAGASRASEAFVVEVGGRELMVALLCDPDGNLVELLQVAKKKKK